MEDKKNLHPFDYQPPTEEQQKKIEEVRAACKVLYDILQALPTSREKSVAITKLEEFSMWTNKGIVFN
jgi:hypothetical protein